jgi:hypothetical protein
VELRGIEDAASGSEIEPFSLADDEASDVGAGGTTPSATPSGPLGSRRATDVSLPERLAALLGVDLGELLAAVAHVKASREG